MSTTKIKKINLPGRWTAVDSVGIIYVSEDFKRVVKKPFIDAHGRKYIAIGGRNRYIHRLVAEYFIPNPGRLPRVEFVNGNMGDPRACNLRWTRNIIRRAGDGRKLSVVTVRRIKSLLSRGDAAATVARMFGVTRSLVSHIKAGRRWGNV